MLLPFKHRINGTLFFRLQMVTAGGDVGVIDSSFGNAGKFKVAFKEGTSAGVNHGVVMAWKR